MQCFLLNWFDEINWHISKCNLPKHAMDSDLSGALQYPLVPFRGLAAVWNQEKSRVWQFWWSGILMFQDWFLRTIGNSHISMVRACLMSQFSVKSIYFRSFFCSISRKASDVGTCFQRVWSLLVQRRHRTFELSGGQRSNLWDALAWIHWGPGKAVKVPLGPGKTVQSRW